MKRARADDEATPRKRGRPAVLSRHAVLQAALELSAADPLNLISVSTVARRLNVTSMAIYKYFGSRDELLQALSAKLLEDFSVEIHPDLDPIQRIECWIRALRNHFLANRQLINLLSWDRGQISVAWENHAGIMFEAVRDMGFEGDAFAETALWIFISGTSAIVYEVRARLTEPSSYVPDYGSLTRQSAEGRALITDFQAKPGHHERLFEFQIRRIVDSLRDLDSVKTPPSKRRRGLDSAGERAG